MDLHDEQALMVSWALIVLERYSNYANYKLTTYLEPLMTPYNRR